MKVIKVIVFFCLLILFGGCKWSNQNTNINGFSYGEKFDELIDVIPTMQSIKAVFIAEVIIDEGIWIEVKLLDVLKLPNKEIDRENPLRLSIYGYRKWNHELDKIIIEKDGVYLFFVSTDFPGSPHSGWEVFDIISLDDDRYPLSFYAERYMKK